MKLKSTFSLITAIGTCLVLPLPVFTNRCDPRILAALNRLPKSRNIILTASNNIKEIVVATSNGYYNTSPRCLFSFITVGTSSTTGTTGTLYLVKIPNSGQPTLEMRPLVEPEPGLLVEPDTGVLRYHMFYKGGVTAFYKCTVNGPIGIAEGLIKLKAEGFSTWAYQEAIQLLTKLGIKPEVRFSSQCP